MGYYRQIHTKIWKDAWFLELDPPEKLLFIYLFSNATAGVSGLYTLPLKVISFETSLDKEYILDTLHGFQKDGKVWYDGHVIWVKNQQLYHATRSPSVQKAIQKEVDTVSDCEIKRLYLEHYTQSDPPKPIVNVREPSATRTYLTEKDAGSGIKPIPTKYHGVLFRSRLEARYAVLFNELGLKWEYEAQGFDLEKLGWYLPDFRVEGDSGKRYFIEIKPIPLTDEEENKVKALQGCPPEHGDGALAVVGTPEVPIIEWTGSFSAEWNQLCHTQLGMLCLSLLEERPFNYNRIETAVKAAKQSRFEHGQFGPPREWPKAD